MRKITDSYLKTHLKHALAQLVPDRAEEIWEKPIEKAAGDEWYLDGVRKPKRYMRKAVIKMAVAAAACLAICMMSVYMLNQRTLATIYLDVNPSVELQINQSEKIIQARANNQDGETILEDMDLRRTDLDVAMNAILGSMVKHGYLSEAKNMVLLSVDSKNPQKADTLRSRLSSEIEECLNSLIGTGAVLGLEVQADDELIQLAAKYGMTPGKAFLLKRLVEANPQLDYGMLADLPLYQLPSYLSGAGMELQDYVSVTGNPDDWESNDVEESEEEVGETEEEFREELEEKSEDAAEESEEESEKKAERKEDAAEENSAEEEDEDKDDKVSSSGRVPTAGRVPEAERVPAGGRAPSSGAERQDSEKDGDDIDSDDGSTDAGSCEDSDDGDAAASGEAEDSFDDSEDNGVGSSSGGAASRSNEDAEGEDSDDSDD